MSEFGPEILWEDGMLLRPQHLQAFQRHCQGLLTRLAGLRPFSYGVRKLKIQAESIGNWKLAVTECDLVMPDGTVVVTGDTAQLEAEEFSHRKFDTPVLDVWLAIPLPKDSAPNVGGMGRSDTEDGSPAPIRGPRYVAAMRLRPDENTGSNAQEYGVKLLNTSIHIGQRPPPGHASLKIAELKKVITEDELTSRYELSESYVPASLTIDASPALYVVLKDLLDKLEEKNAELLAQLSDRRDLLGAESGERPDTLIKVQATNGLLPILRQIAGQPSMHPFDVYLQLTRLIGELAIFSDRWEPPKLVIYDHDDPLNAFVDLKRKWVALLEQAITVRVDRVPFGEPGPEDPRHARVAKLPFDYLESSVVLHLGVQTARPVDEIAPLFLDGRTILTAPGDLLAIQRARDHGIACEPDRDPPPALRDRRGHVFFKISQFGELWESAREAQCLALAGEALDQDEELHFSIFATNLNR